MNIDLDSLAASLAALIGGDSVTKNQALHIQELTPALIIKPATAEQARACLQLCAEADAAVIPAGAMTWLEGGNPLRRADVVLSVERLNRVIEYSPPDLMAIVEAGVALRDFQAQTRSAGQWLPLDPAGADGSTIGAIAATGASGALRLGYGTPRDYVIGLRLAHIDGTESRSGGRVAKNVAGYDLNKLYVGSFGTLALITEVNVKLRPLPERSATMMITAAQRERLLELAKRIFASAAQPASLLVTEGVSESAGRSALLLRFVESEAAVAYQLLEVENLLDGGFQAALLNEDEAEKVWKKAVNIDELADYAVRVSVPLANVATMFQNLLAKRAESFASADLGVGIIRLAFEAEAKEAVDLIRAMREEAAGVGGTLFLERAAPSVKTALDAWGEVGQLANLMRGIKQNFDPQGRLSPGRFVAGI